MYCSKCRTQNDDGARRCAQCDADLHPGRWEMTSPGGRARPQIPNYLAHAILCTIFCCQPFGIVSIVYAAQVDGKLSAMDYEGARECSDKAWYWCKIAFFLALLPAAIWLAFVFVFGFGALLHAN